jgi:hypothetical protein
VVAVTLGGNTIKVFGMAVHPRGDRFMPQVVGRCGMKLGILSRNTLQLTEMYHNSGCYCSGSEVSRRIGVPNMWLELLHL